MRNSAFPSRSGPSGRRRSARSRVAAGRGGCRVRQRVGGDHIPQNAGKAGVIFCPISEAVREYPDLVQQYLGTVVPSSDNFFAALNSAVFTDGCFVYIPKGVRCPMELSTYFRINARTPGSSSAR